MEEDKQEEKNKKDRIQSSSTVDKSTKSASVSNSNTSSSEKTKHRYKLKGHFTTEHNTDFSNISTNEQYIKNSGNHNEHTSSSIYQDAESPNNSHTSNSYKKDQSTHLPPQYVSISQPSLSQPAKQNDIIFDVDVLAALTQGDNGRYANYATSADSMLALLESRKYRANKGENQDFIKSPPGSIPLASPNVNLLAKSSCFPSWGSGGDIPITFEELDSIFHVLAKRFGFQQDSVENMSEHLKVMLDSRASRMQPQIALDTLHADYIGGKNANYRKWYFAAQIDIYDQTEQEKQMALDMIDEHEQLSRMQEKWDLRMRSLSNKEKVHDLALYLCLWGEAAPVRFTPEILCFIYKMASDYSCHESIVDMQEAQEDAYLNDIIIPLYQFFRDQTYVKINGKYTKRERDHDKIIGYDDANQFFWNSTFYDKILVAGHEEQTLGQLLPRKRYIALKDVNWKKTFKKTYKEKRTWMHASINFSRVWVIHIVTFWYYISANAYSLYLNLDKDIAKEELPVQISIVALGGAIACLLVLIGSCAELMYLPASWYNSRNILRRIAFLILLMIVNVAPSYYCVIIDRQSAISRLVSITQLIISIITTLYLSLVPSSRLFMGPSKHTRKELANESFTGCFPPLKSIDRIMSVCLWICVFSCKLLESYFFLALSFKDPLKVISTMTITNCHDAILGDLICKQMPHITIFIMFLMDLVLYFLDTYLWYIIWNTIFSVARSFYLGISIWSPWRNIFSRLPKRIFVKLLATTDIQVKYKPKVLCSQIWNAIVITMYREHLINVDHAQRMLYQQEINPIDGQRSLKTPTFFVSQEDTSFKTEYFPQRGEAERRIHFFAQSLTTPMPPPHPVECMPTFTVLTPHYGEKILLTLREIIREEDTSTRVTLLEYLKQLHPVEWDNFVKDTKLFVDTDCRRSIDTRDGCNSGFSISSSIQKDFSKSINDDLPFYCIGFKDSRPEYALRTRIWASLRAQTLYRTVSGFMNYHRAIKLLYRVENPEIAHTYANDKTALENDLDKLSRRKFKFLVAMQRYAKFTPSESEDAEFLFKAFPELQVAYIEEISPIDPNGEITYYSSLVDGTCELTENGKRKPRYRIRLPGNPILGDGKSDNQNHAIIFYRGEFLQLIDANQDNYLEECLKVRNVLGEFETLEPISISPYSAAYKETKTSAVAIVGAREYIFSENIGVLGDVAAGKEQTFGTLTQRIMAKIGGKLHYGHPDFLNAIFMTTRGGVSKAQKGLHLNEDIYAGMNAFTRGGRIKHTEYFQCGKGRDLGFGSILNFTTKIGTGMGEQMLSREYYYIGTQLPLDRFLTFYYAHPGFHINNIFIMLSVQLFMLVILFVSTMGSSLTVCEYNPDVPPEAPLVPEGCFNLVPIIDWVKRCILSIFVVFFAAFLPLVLQELTEKGFWRSLTRMGRHFISLSPLFEIFVTQIYTNSVLENLVFGGARYIGTGRGFATSRISFATLYSRFTGPSIYVGARNLVIMIFASVAYWIPHLVYFWFTVIALIISPFVFNPNQFALVDFLMDYKEFIRWLSRGNSKTHANSWISHTRSSRARITGYKRSKPTEATNSMADIPRAGFFAIFISELVLPLLYAGLCTLPYAFAKSFDIDDPKVAAKGPSPLIRIGVIALAPIILNIVGLVIFFGLSVGIGCILSIWVVKFGSLMAALAHAWSVISLIIVFEVLVFLEELKLNHVLLGVVAMIAIQRAVLKSLTVVFLTREFKQDESNRGWWTGKWYGRGLGWHVITQPGREFICKIIEMSEFATDFILGHIILFFLSLFTIIPYINTAHSVMLFWLKPSQQIRDHIWTVKQRKKRRRVATTYGMMFASMFLLFVALVVAPLTWGKDLVSKLIPKDGLFI
ncbi:1,3-beta-glucan synthase component-domain-containing protein [Cokeromyces recurvatus]|uniref:1,3-beta-glucan synthase component-domain-containing protein n=1 Tax=Cokeromyces recurvatus TaxID=90255 RepID=UPI0022201004|nr:1,3-beta-glucan synthase component-domain-containing protein [Cokeromyces recurvatus]KAI7908108.1 1,3-beta-glucan synthase component-domain-containing protein [Cokeromyces recurvatus]